MPTSTSKHILMIEDNHSDAEIVRRFLALAGPEDFHVTTADTLQTGKALLVSRRFDLILLDQRLPDSDESQTLPAILPKAGAIPVVVLTGLNDELHGASLVAQGAHDYLVKGRFDAHLLTRVIRYAIERHRLQRENEAYRQRELRSREVATLQDISQQSARPVKIQPLAEAMPHIFKDFTERYEEMLELAVERRIYKSHEGPLQEKIIQLVQSLAQIEAGPKEVVEIYGTAIENKIKESEEDSRTQALLEEGRLVLIEVLGALVKAYRSLAKSAGKSFGG